MERGSPKLRKCHVKESVNTVGARRSHKLQTLGISIATLELTG